MILLRRNPKTIDRQMINERVLILFCAFTLLTLFTVELSSAQAPTKTKQSVGQGTVAPRATKLTLQELATRSEIVAVGSIAGLRSEWNNDKSRIITRATLRVDEYVKGDPGQKTITLVYPGGEVGREGEVYSHIATFQNDEEVMVFAGKDQEGNFRVTGGDQGKMKINKDNASGKKMVSSTMSVDDLKTQVKNYLKANDNK